MATIKRVEDLHAWRLSREVKTGVYALIDKPAVRKDLKFCDQIRESARSAPRNIAEGFARYRPREFARFLSIAIGSLEETRNHLEDALELRYRDDEEYLRLRTLASRAIGAAVRLSKYLETCPDRTPQTNRNRERK
jgi:four helix bundle protein